MNNNIKNLIIALTVLIMSGISSTWAVGENPLISANQKPFGKSYAEWAGNFWQWYLRIPQPSQMKKKTAHPFNDTNGENCAVAQGGEVFYLVGDPTFGTGVERSCEVPNGVALFFPLINAECSTVEDAPFFGTDETSLQACVTNIGFGTVTDTLNLIVDGKVFDSVDLQTFLIDPTQSPVFNFVIPDENNIGVDTSVKGNSGQSVAGGYYVMIAPLSPGKHSIEFEALLNGGPFAGFAQKVSYEIEVEDEVED